MLSVDVLSGLDSGDGYCEEIGALVYERMASGMSLAQISQLQEFPSYVTLCRWRRENKHFAMLASMAREQYADMLVDEIVGISDDSGNDVKIDSRGNERVDSDAIARSKLRITTRQWLAGKLSPKYAEKSSAVPASEESVSTLSALLAEIGSRSSIEPKLKVVSGTTIDMAE